MTILSIRALKEFNYISTALRKDSKQPLRCEELAAKLQAALTEKLWDNELKYLVSYFGDGSKDSHIYIGSLLAAHFGLLSPQKTGELVQTAKNKLLDNKLGIYNVFPMDFQTLIEFLKCSGNEAGDPFLYLNGGIWPHGNAWYALALLALDENESALKFIKDIMTLDGIMKSPGGQPAMYEYRCGDKSDPSKYGRVDKPQFLWAGAWYLYCCYHLLGVRENEWNVSIHPFSFETAANPQFTLIAGGKELLVNFRGRGKYIKKITYNDSPFFSAVIPAVPPGEKLEFSLGAPETPYLLSCDSILNSISWATESRQLSMNLNSFAGHESNAKIISPFMVQSVLINNSEFKASVEEQANGIFLISLPFRQQTGSDTIVVNFF